MKDFIIGNNGMVIISLIYIYMGASANKLVNLFSNKDSTLHNYEIYMMISGCAVLAVVIGVTVYVARK